MGDKVLVLDLCDPKVWPYPDKDTQFATDECVKGTSRWYCLPKEELYHRYGIKDWRSKWRLYLFAWLVGIPVFRDELTGRINEYVGVRTVRSKKRKRGKTNRQVLPKEKAFKAVLEQSEPTIYDLDVFKEVYELLKEKGYFDMVKSRVVDVDKDEPVLTGRDFIDEETLQRLFKDCKKYVEMETPVPVKEPKRWEKDSLSALLEQILEEFDGINVPVSELVKRRRGRAPPPS